MCGFSFLLLLLEPKYLSESPWPDDDSADLMASLSEPSGSAACLPRHHLDAFRSLCIIWQFQQSVTNWVLMVPNMFSFWVLKARNLKPVCQWERPFWRFWGEAVPWPSHSFGVADALGPMTSLHLFFLLCLYLCSLSSERFFHTIGSSRVTHWSGSRVLLPANLYFH